MIQTASKSLREAINRNSNGIARIQTLIDGRRRGFGKLIKKEGGVSLPIALKLYDTIFYSLKQRAQTAQFGEFLSDLDMDCITKDYYHIQKVHMREGDTVHIENCLRYFAYAVHFEDHPTEKDECRSVKRKQRRMKHFNTDLDSKQEQKEIALHEETDKDIWRLKQHYIQSQLDIIHSYLVHSKWERIVQSKQPADDDGEAELKAQTHDDNDLDMQKK
eukprot:191557_1